MYVYVCLYIQYTYIYVCRHVFMHAWIYECIHLGMYIAWYTQISVYVCRHACVHTCVPNLLPCHCTHLMSPNKCDCNIANVTHPAIMLNGHVGPTFLYMCAKTQPTAISTLMLLPCMGQQQICLPICHIYKLAHGHMTQLSQYKYLI